VRTESKITASYNLPKEKSIMNLHLSGKLALVTGSTDGIGKGIAKALLEEGVRVIINGRSKDKVFAVAEELSAFGKTYGAPGDLSELSGAEKVIEAVEKVGDLDILINNMGVYKQAEFEQISDEAWEMMLNVNVLSVVRMCRHFLPKMLARNTGRIQVVASECGIKPIRELFHYSVSKTALLGLGRGLAELTKGSEVTVNTILPGPTWTEGGAAYQTNRAKLEGKSLEQIIAEYFSLYEPTSLLQRFATVEEVAKTCVYYCSDYAIATNGAPIRVEGGIVRSI
jgi:NAD(P)-dependent dehydrogenase (short-subunit alcohol dehydrogenase family)